MKVLRRIAVLAAIVGVSASLTVSAGTAATTPVSPASITTAVFNCIHSDPRCAAALTRATAQVAACGADSRCRTMVLRLLTYLPDSWRNAIHAGLLAAVAGGANQAALQWLIDATAPDSGPTT